MSGKTSPSPNSEVPPSQSRPPSRGTPPQSPLLTGISPARSPLPERQSNLSSLVEESNIHGKDEASKVDSSYKSDIGRADTFISQDKTKEENRKDIKPEILSHDTSINESSKSEKEQEDSTTNEYFQHGGRRTELFGSEVTDHSKSEASKIEVSLTKPSDTSKADLNSESKLTKQDSVDKKLTFSKDEKIKPSESESSKPDSTRSSNSSTPLPTGSRPASRADTLSKEPVKQKAETENQQSLERLQSSDLSQGKDSSGNLINETDTSENKQSTAKKTSVIVDDPSQSSPKRPTVLKSSSPNFKAEKSSSSSASEGGATQDGRGPKETVVNGDHESPKKSPSKAAVPKKLATSQSPMKSPNKASSPKTPDTPSTAEKKKLPMNKIQVGAAPSPNLKTVKSKIGSLENAKHKPGGGHVKIESRKLNFNVQPKIEAKNETYAPKGGDKKIQSVKLQWNAKPKVGSLENASHKPGGGDKKIESVKLDFKDKAKPKVGSKDNIKHVAGGGSVKVILNILILFNY
ncbi:hypothetical protein O3M35_010241 [Rhynocoris fuscipes]|uniref:Microtubule-associated protein n=1 Tax=Rhynocoris fuscipes TaxID=488301 RepID=A0AAW1D1C5_9HEMI